MLPQVALCGLAYPLPPEISVTTTTKFPFRGISLSMLSLSYLHKLKFRGCNAHTHIVAWEIPLRCKGRCIPVWLSLVKRWKGLECPSARQWWLCCPTVSSWVTKVVKWKRLEPWLTTANERGRLQNKSGFAYMKCENVYKTILCIVYKTYSCSSNKNMEGKGSLQSGTGFPTGGWEEVWGRLYFFFTSTCDVLFL